MKGFVKNIKTEMRHITWPTKKEVIADSRFAVLAILILVFCIHAADTVFQAAVYAVLGLVG